MSDEQIIEKLGLGNMPQEVQQETLQSINSIIEMRVMGILDDLMDDSQRAKFEEISKQGPEAVWTWLSKEFTDVAKLYEAALQDYLDEKLASK